MAAVQTRDEIIAALEQQERDSVTYWNAFERETFFVRIGESWSPAETVRHLIKSLRPVAKAFGTSWLVLRVMFGKPRRASASYDELSTRYRGLLAEGGQAGRFAPSERSENDEAWRAKIMSDFVTVNRELRKAIARWPDTRLDRLQLPHPLLGKVTLREMLFFTLYHLRHHIDVVERNRAELKSNAS